MWLRLPRARPEPRLAPKDPVAAAGVALEVSAGAAEEFAGTSAPDGLLSDMT